MTLSTLAIILGAGLALLCVFGLINPKTFSIRAREFPRCAGWGYALMALGTGWFLYNFNKETLQEFLAYKKYLLLGFAGLGLAACVFVRDFLAVRGLSICLLLLAAFTLNLTRPFEHPARLVLVLWAYIWIVLAMWFTISPWRLRDYIAWVTASPARLRLQGIVGVIFGIIVVALGLTVLRV